MKGKVVSSSITIQKAESPEEHRLFLGLPYEIYKNHPQWRAPLRFERADQLSLKKNPGAPENRVFFLAFRGGQAVGRIAAFVNEKHNEHYADKTGFFGYFDCIEDDDIAMGLLKSAQDWLLSQGMTDIVGPAQWSVNEECGLLVRGFDEPPVVMMPFGRPDYQKYMASDGFEKAVDMFAFQAELAAGYPRSKFLSSLLKYAERNKTISWRPLKPKVFKDEVALIMDIFNDAWSDNWGFLPFSDEQIDHMAKEIKPLIFKEGLWIGYIDDEPVAFICMIPDLNEVTHGLNGKILPFGWAKLIWRLKVKGPKQARIPLMGLRKGHQNTRKGLALIAQLCETVFIEGRKKGFTHCELSWILEDNTGMIGICEEAAAKNYKTYRMYKKALNS